MDRLGCSAPADLTLSTCRVTGKDKGPPPPAGSPSGGEQGRPGGRLRASSEDELVYVCTRCDKQINVSALFFINIFCEKNDF